MNSASNPVYKSIAETAMFWGNRVGTAEVAADVVTHGQGLFNPKGPANNNQSSSSMNDVPSGLGSTEAGLDPVKAIVHSNQPGSEVGKGRPQ